MITFCLPDVAILPGHTSNRLAIMSKIILQPPPEVARKWGLLAHVEEAERTRILALPYGQFQPALKRLKKEITEARKVKPMSFSI